MRNSIYVLKRLGWKRWQFNKTNSKPDCHL